MTSIPKLIPGTEGSVIRIAGAGYGMKRFGVGAVAEGDTARQVQDGPLVPGPWAYAYGLSVCIDNHGGTKAESDAMTASGQEIEVGIGDTVEINGDLYLIDWYRQGSWVDKHNITLTLVPGWTADADEPVTPRRGPGRPAGEKHNDCPTCGHHFTKPQAACRDKAACARRQQSRKA